MAIITDIKDAIRDSANAVDNTLNFNFNEIQVAEFPYLFFYIPLFKLEEVISDEYWRKLTLVCVLEYEKEEHSSNTDLWAYMENMSKIIYNFEFKDTRLIGRNPEWKIVDGVLQLTFDLEFYVKETDSYDLMQELLFTLNKSNRIIGYNNEIGSEINIGAEV